jgi:hypothetical protein
MGQHESKLEPITENDIEIIRSGWNSIDSRDEFGLDIMISLFLTNRDIKSKWIFASNLETEEEMRSNSQVKYHAKKVIDLLSKVVERIVKSDPEKIDLEDFKLIKLGSNHFHYGVIRDDFIVSLFNLFKIKMFFFTFFLN